MAPTLRRNLTPTVADLLAAFRVVMLGGARQTGKTTLVTDLLQLPPGAQRTLDDAATLRSAVDDPVGFVQALPRPAVVDEFQRAGPDFLLAVKQQVDRDRSRGQMLLTGSANYLADRSVSETLAGRAGRVVLWPLSGGERRGVHETFVDRLLDPAGWPPAAEPTDRTEIGALLLEGGFPEIVLEGLTGRRRRAG